MSPIDISAEQQTQGAIGTLYTPYNDKVPATLSEFLGYAQTGKGLLWSQYGFTLPQAYKGLTDAFERKCVLKGIFDHTEAETPTEHPLIIQFSKAVDPGVYRIGTSPDHHQLLHLKCYVINYPMDGVFPEAAQFATWRDAAKAGYPVVWSGSWNASPAASRQANVVYIIPGIDFAAGHVTEIEQLFHHIDQNEPHYSAKQPFSLAEAMVPAAWKAAIAQPITKEASPSKSGTPVDAHRRARGGRRSQPK